MSLQASFSQGSSNVLQAVMSIILAAISMGLFFLAMRLMGLPIEVGEIFEYGIFDIISTPRNLLQVIFWAGPLVLTGIAVGIAFNAGLFNIGGQGQMAMGGVVAAIWAASIVPVYLKFLDSPWIMVPSTMLMGALAGALWGFIPGYLRAKYGAHEVITTILMNLVSISLILYLIGTNTYSPFIDKTSLNANARTEVITPSARLTLISEKSSFLNWSIAVILLVAVLCWFLLYMHPLGYRIRAVGLNPSAAEAAGINVEQVIMITMAISGAVAGLGGALLVQGNSPFRYTAQLEGTRGFDGIAVSLIGFNNPLLIIFAALLFGFLQQSRVNIDSNTDVPPEFIFAFQALIILFAAAPLLSQKIIERLKKLWKANQEEVS